MIVVTAMPVAKAKARTITAKIIFMTLALSLTHVASQSRDRAFCDRHHGTAFFIGH